MASFVRQLNMYGFRKVVNIEQSGLVKPERDDTEFQHLYFLQGHEHLLEHIKRKVSIVKSEDTKVRQEDLSKLLYEVQVLRSQQENMEMQMQDMKQQNDVLWREVVSLRQNHTQQQKVMNKLIQFLFSQMQSNTPSTVGMKRKLPLMLDDGCSTPPASKFNHSHSAETLQESFYIQSDMVYLFREKCLMLIKEEPVSPGVQGRGEGVPLGSCEVCTEPPVLPVAMVQSVLEGRGSNMGERRAKRPMLERSEIPDGVENVDMSLEDLQLLLRSHQQSMETSAAAMDPFTFSLSLNEWNFTEMDPTLKSELANALIPAAMSQYMFQGQEGETFPAAGYEEQ
ncbi:hypothetical protein cypCar_00025985 [Cyprinus carpio]|nr:hypothetical protein cypCar_00025985 [Cyprinus carpio]